MRKRKLLDRLTNNPNGATFNDLRTLLAQEGFELERVTGSHHIFKKAGIKFVIPVHANRVKSVYVRRVIQLIKSQEEKPMAEELRYPIIIYPADEGGYVAEVPALKGCLAQGETQAECLQELNTVQSLWIESARRNRQRIPTPSEALAQLRKLVA